MKTRKLGFTLIELLVVMAIIAVLAAVGMASYRSANERGRNARRAADLEQVRAALEMYRTDEGEYPDDLDDLLTDDHMNEIPIDPINDSNYSYCTDNAQYQLCAVFEGDDPASCLDSADAFDDACAGNYGVRNP
jgi:general secretion pathway protein G